MIIFYWLFFYRQYLETWQLIKRSKVLQAFLLFFGLHLIGLIWTSDLRWGMHIVGKERLFIFAPILMTFALKKHIKFYIASYIAAMTFSEAISYMIWLQIIPPIFSASHNDPTPFMSHITYNPFLALSIYLIGHFLLFDRKQSIYKKIFLSIFFTTMSINMFITGGRAGQVAYFLTIFTISLQYFKDKMLRAFAFSSVLIIAIFSTAYLTSEIFHNRVNQAITEASNYDQNRNSSVGLRINFAINTIDIIKDNPIIGVGTGDFKTAYKETNSINSPELPSTVQPHNMYLLVFSQLGVLGFLSLLYIFYRQIEHAISQKDKLIKHLGIYLPLMFGVIMLSDSYLLGHYTTALYIYFSSFLYKPSEKQ